MPGTYKYDDVKAKFNPKKCMKCQFHSEHTSLGYHIRLTRTKAVSVSCNYMGITRQTCLKPIGKRETYDVRGAEYDNCRLFKEGKMIKRSEYDEEDEDSPV